MDVAAQQSLNRLLSRLEHTLLSPASESRLRHSAYERKRVGANIEHARSLLLILEKQSGAIRIQTQKQQAQTDVARQRDTVKRLTARLQELDQLDNDLVSDESDEERGDTQDDYGPAIKNITTGIDIGEGPQVSAPEATTEIRPRRTQEKSETSPNAAMSTGISSAKQELFAGKKQHLDFETSEALINHNTKEQEALTNGLLGLARALKQSSLNFASSLESEKEIMARAEGGLDKSAQGMDAAERKMGMLRSMSEGQGWYGRLKLYGFIGGLWLACFLLVFVGPKLRL